MTTMTETTTQVYQLYIRATPEQIWEAITNPDLTAKYFFGGRIELADGRRRAYGPDGSSWGDEAVIEADPPSWRRRSRAASRGRSSRRRAGSRS